MRGLACSATFMRQFEKLARQSGWEPGKGKRGFKKHTVEALSHHFCLKSAQIYQLLKAAELAPAILDIKNNGEVTHPSILVEAARSTDPVATATQAVEEGWTAAQVRQEVTRQRLANTPPIPTGTFPVVYADPPWAFANSGFEQSAAQVYPVMETPAIMALAVPRAPMAACFLWVPNSLLPDGLAVLKAWGFEYKTNFVWVKDRAPGMGWYCNTLHEMLLLGMRGALPFPARKSASVLEAPRQAHSQKPDAFYDLIESMYAGPYLELFSRRARNGWTGWGSDLPR